MDSIKKISIGGALLIAVIGGVLFSNKTGHDIPTDDQMLGGAALNRELRANELTNIQNKFNQMKVTYGEFTQVTKDSRILIRNGEVVDDALLTLLPSNVIVNVYESPAGTGFQLIQELSDRTVSYGFGADAASYTGVVMKATTTATST